MKLFSNNSSNSRTDETEFNKIYFVLQKYIGNKRNNL